MTSRVSYALVWSGSSSRTVVPFFRGSGGTRINWLMNSGLIYPSASKASALIGGKVGASLAGASALGGEGGAVTFPVISVHCEGGVVPALPKIGPAAIVRAPSSAGFGFGTGVAGATAGDAFFHVAHTFDLRDAPFFILQRYKGQVQQCRLNNKARRKKTLSADLLLAGNVEPSESIVIFG